MARVNAMMSGKHVAPAAAPVHAAPAPVAAQVVAEDAGSVVARVNAMTGGPVAPVPSSTWRWSGKDVGGYDPKGRSASSSSLPAAVSPAVAAAVAEDPAAVMARVMAMI